MTTTKRIFKYSEGKTAVEMAREIFCDVWNDLTEDEMKSKVKWVRNQLQRQGYQHRQNKEKKNFEKVKEFFEENPTATPSQAAEATGLSRPSIYKFRAMGDTYLPSGEIKHSAPICLSVSDNLHQTLKNIISLHLKTKTFECDLTFGEGGFYKKGIPVPTHIYDLFNYGDKSPAGTSVQKLDLKNPKPIAVGSVVVDLPITIDELSFKSSTQLYNTYDEYINYAATLLNRGGILVFSTADFILRNGEDGTWAADYAISAALSFGFSLKDKIHLVRKGDTVEIDGISVQSGLKDSVFLIFSKN